MKSAEHIERLANQIARGERRGRDAEADIMEALGFQVKRATWWRYQDGSAWYALPHLLGDTNDALRRVERERPDWAVMLSRIDKAGFSADVQSHWVTSRNLNTLRRRHLFAEGAHYSSCPATAITVAFLRALAREAFNNRALSA